VNFVRENPNSKQNCLPKWTKAWLLSGSKARGLLPPASTRFVSVKPSRLARNAVCSVERQPSAVFSSVLCELHNIKALHMFLSHTRSSSGMYSVKWKHSCHKFDLRQNPTHAREVWNFSLMFYVSQFCTTRSIAGSNGDARWWQFSLFYTKMGIVSGGGGNVKVSCWNLLIVACTDELIDHTRVVLITRHMGLMAVILCDARLLQRYSVGLPRSGGHRPPAVGKAVRPVGYWELQGCLYHARRSYVHRRRTC
jgi:hypothetical protein